MKLMIDETVVEVLLLLKNLFKAMDKSPLENFFGKSENK